MLLDVLDEVPQTLTRMVTGALIVDITKGPLNGVGPGAVGGQVEQLEAGMCGQPLFDLRRVVNFGIVGHHREVGECPSRVGVVQGVEQVQEEARRSVATTGRMRVLVIMVAVIAIVALLCIAAAIVIH